MSIGFVRSKFINIVFRDNYNLIWYICSLNGTNYTQVYSNMGVPLPQWADVPLVTSEPQVPPDDRNKRSNKGFSEGNKGVMWTFVDIGGEDKLAGTLCKFIF